VTSIKLLLEKYVSSFPFVALEWSKEIIFHTKKSWSHHKEKESNVRHMRKAVIKIVKRNWCGKVISLISLKSKYQSGSTWSIYDRYICIMVTKVFFTVFEILKVN
jgi:hypothetical protein